MQRRSNILRLQALGRKMGHGAVSPVPNEPHVEVPVENVGASEIDAADRPLRELAPRNPAKIGTQRKGNSKFITQLEKERIDYPEYLQSATWQTKRRKKLVQANGRCQVCGSDARLEVHHNTYARVGNERMSDLLVLCRECHQLFHDERRLNSSPSASNRRPPP